MTSDEQIVEMLWGRKEEGLTLAEQQYGKKLKRLAGTILPEGDAEECVNDTFLAVWNSIPPNRPQFFYSYMAKICRNLAFNRLEWSKAEKRNAMVVELSEELQEVVPDGRDETGEKELGGLLREFLKTLPRQKKQIFVKRYWYGNSIKELAQEYGYSESRIKSMLFRVRKELRHYLEQEGIAI